MSASRIILIGEAFGPSYLKAPEKHRALWPYPPQSAGARLQRMTGLGPRAYLRRTERRNLLPGYPGKRWPAMKAREAAAALVKELVGQRVIFVGRRVATAFGLECAPFHTWMKLPADSQAAIVPHTSGLNRWYNSEENVEAARAFWRAVEWPTPD